MSLDLLQMLMGLKAVSGACPRGILAGTRVGMVAPTGRDAHGGESGERGTAPVRAFQRGHRPRATSQRAAGLRHLPGHDRRCGARRQRIAQQRHPARPAAARVAGAGVMGAGAGLDRAGGGRWGQRDPAPRVPPIPVLDRRPRARHRRALVLQLGCPRRRPSRDNGLGHAARGAGQRACQYRPGGRL